MELFIRILGSSRSGCDRETITDCLVDSTHASRMSADARVIFNPVGIRVSHPDRTTAEYRDMLQQFEREAKQSHVIVKLLIPITTAADDLQRKRGTNHSGEDAIQGANVSYYLVFTGG
ncbi:unnamed protein product [Leptosia nina]|uniref:Uncharacterized protein n=1 Tax=Leptosia nina TaxID=320188 RepID=A0AAV1IUZ5_9NEOP